MTRVGLFLVPGFSMMALAAASEPLRAANRMAGASLYDWRLVSADGQPVASSSGFDLMAPEVIGGTDFDSLVVVASMGLEGWPTTPVTAWLRRLAASGCLLGAVSTGAFILARAGLLRGRRATVHWELADEFSAEFPDLELSKDLFVIDHDRFTCGGGTAGLDMTLAMIERRHGPRLAVAVAEQFLHTRIRQPTDSQRLAAGSRHGFRDPRIATAAALMERHLEHPLPTPAIALRCGVSPRQLERLFLEATGSTPARFYLDLRLQAARRRLRETHEPILDVAMRCGFANASHFGKCYREAFGETPARSRDGSGASAGAGQ